MPTRPGAPERPFWIAIASGVVVGLAIWVSFGALALRDATSGRRVGLLPGASALLVSIAIMSAGFLATAKWRAATPALLLSILLLLPWLPVPVPDVFLTWTGPVTALLWCAAIVCALPRIIGAVPVQRFAALTDARTAPRIACALAFVAFVAVRARQEPPPTGDEPHYLLIAQSLLADHDLKVANNYENRSYSTFYGGLLRPHYSRPGVDGSLYSLHAPGLPALIAPAFAIGGYSAVVLWIAGIAALGSLFVWKAAHTLTGDSTSAWFGWAVASLTSPMAIEGTLVYPDAVAGTALSAGVLAMLIARSLSLRGAFGAGLLLGVLPWLHTRFALPAGLLFLMALGHIFTDADRPRRPWLALALTIPASISVMAWLLFFFRVYGAFSPGAAYENQIPLEPQHVLVGLLALIGDQEFGLIPNAPVHLLWIGGLWTLFRQHKRLASELMIMAFPYAIAVAGFPNWWGGSTPARYLAPLVFPLAIAVAPLFQRQDVFGRSMSLGLLVISVLMAFAFGFGENGGLAYAFAEGRSRLLDWVAPLVNLPGAFPSYFRAVSATGVTQGSLYRELVVPGALWGVALGATWICARWLSGRQLLRAIAAPAVAAACLSTAFTLGVTSAWWTAGVPHLTVTRAQLALIARAGSRLRPLGVGFRPFRAVPAEEALQQLVVSTSVLDAPPGAALLFLHEVPPGDYRVRRSFGSAPRGELRLFIGRGAGPIVRWQVSDPNVDILHVPVQASAVTIVGDADAAASLRPLSLTPVRRVTTAWANATRARDAARYGSYVVYAIDNRVMLDADGFWVLGGRQPDVVIAALTPTAALRLEVRNVAAPNLVRVSTGGWSATKSLAPDERWPITVPLDAADAAHVVNFRVEQGARSGGQLLGCRVTFLE